MSLVYVVTEAFVYIHLLELLEALGNCFMRNTHKKSHIFMLDVILLTFFSPKAVMRYITEELTNGVWCIVVKLSLMSPTVNRNCE